MQQRLHDRRNRVARIRMGGVLIAAALQLPRNAMRHRLAAMLGHARRAANDRDWPGA
jgi:hypothetical protein